MNDLLAVSELISHASKPQNFYVYLEPEIPDLTTNATLTLVFCTEENEVKLTLDLENLPFLLSLLNLTFFAKDKKLFCWNIKNFFSYALKHSGKPFKTEASLVDIKILESYLGMPQKAPGSFLAALARVRRIFNVGGWSDVQSVYRRIHLPLMVQVVPQMEVMGLPDVGRGSLVHAYYEIDGQKNGRLRCHKAFLNSYNPHTLGPEEKKALLPLQDHIFMYFDYRSMEVAVLQWLSGDEKLKEILESRGDVYAKIWEAVVGKPMEGKGERETAKKIFLPVIYGQSASSLSESLNIKLSTAEQIADRIRDLFKPSIALVEAHQAQAVSTKWSKDRFGRRRHFPDKEYKARDFAIQAPAAVICLDKLISLNKTGIPIAFHVHDGYVVLAKKSNWKEVYVTTKTVLELESDLAPGLRLFVDCKAGKSLADLKSIKKGER